ncbi:4-azaleucine resistance probable transporter AzlC [Alkalibacterium subtropicum]|uniref:4-azaleucine resistance probable transporter AzlC n=1 Tax=Alkalibacterium subtropicum TaxID=753702 RepID=A0A1I1I9I1_9LACT|nr:AzlC family ABC transporter permease [Alkalibacterium subtropicum]SFC29920.1 4-azaleucine resistance probable transporter AzlC [Alkalibacterium subtropicum]
MKNVTVMSGMRASMPIMASYIALGIACGIVLYDAGVSVLAIFLMSALVYAGAAQFLTGSMVALGAAVPSVILMVFFLNLRHILMSASISRYVKNKSLGFLGLFGHTLSDESFGINYSRFQTEHWTANEAMVTSLLNYSAWTLSTVLGGIIGSQFTINTLIMNYALIAMFICMMVMQFVSKAHIIAGIVSVVLSVVLTAVLKHNIALVIATVLASFIGYYLENNAVEGGVKANE